MTATARRDAMTTPPDAPEALAKALAALPRYDVNHTPDGRPMLENPLGSWVAWPDIRAALAASTVEPPTAPLASRDVYEAWSAAMDRQGRPVASERRSWDTLPQQERDLDADIAYQLNQRTASTAPLAWEEAAAVALAAADDAGSEPDDWRGSEYADRLADAFRAALRPPTSETPPLDVWALDMTRLGNALRDTFGWAARDADDHDWFTAATTVAQSYAAEPQP